MRVRIEGLLGIWKFHHFQKFEGALFSLRFRHRFEVDLKGFHERRMGVEDILLQVGAKEVS